LLAQGCPLDLVLHVKLLDVSLVLLGRQAVLVLQTVKLRLEAQELVGVGLTDLLLDTITQLLKLEVLGYIHLILMKHVQLSIEANINLVFHFFIGGFRVLELRFKGLDLELVLLQICLQVSDVFLVLVQEVSFDIFKGVLPCL